MFVTCLDVAHLMKWDDNNQNRPEIKTRLTFTPEDLNWEGCPGCGQHTPSHEE